MKAFGDLVRASRDRIAYEYSLLKRTRLVRKRHGPKVFGIGYPKTGTTTLGSCFKELGFRHQSWDMRLAVEVVRNRLQKAFRIADRHDSFEDWPWFRIYKELDARYPGSKFILTVRRDTSTYLRSLENHQKRQGVGTKEFQKPSWWDEIFGSNGNDYQRRALAYEQHNREVQEYFKDRPEDLLVVCWENGDGWEKLCRFLEKNVPTGPFPHLNRSSTASVESSVEMTVSGGSPGW
jgi:hypothetical protein